MPSSIRNWFAYPMEQKTESSLQCHSFTSCQETLYSVVLLPTSVSLVTYNVHKHILTLLSQWFGTKTKGLNICGALKVMDLVIMWNHVETDTHIFQDVTSLQSHLNDEVLDRQPHHFTVLNGASLLPSRAELLIETICIIDQGRLYIYLQVVHLVCQRHACRLASLTDSPSQRN